MSRRADPMLRFLGAADTVTGSRYLIEAKGRRILVDCGLFQGYKTLRLRNWRPFPVRPANIDAVLLTHAHLDHSGYVPRLVAGGFRGRVICTSASAELCALLLPDSGHLFEEEARFARRHGYSEHRRPLPLYTRAQAEASLEFFETIDFDEEVALGAGMSALFIPAVHLLGAAQVRVTIDGLSVHFSGDLGNERDPLMRAPVGYPGSDVLVCESTYGNRQHPSIDPEDEIAPILNRTFQRGGSVLVPGFAVGRSQGLMLHVARLIRKGKIPPVPVYLDSPMAIDATDIYHRHHDEHRVGWQECEEMFALAQRANTVEQSKAIDRMQGPMIVLSASGMLTGGRVLHHLVAFGTDRRNTILLSGFQAGGTRGALLVSGERRLRVFVREIEILAEVAQLHGLSGHADGEGLLRWMAAGPAPRMTYVTHGEREASDTLRRRVRHELGRAARVPEHLESVQLERPR